STDLTFTEDRTGRFAAYGWHTVTVEDGNDLAAIEGAIAAARAETERPSFLSIRTHIGYGSPHKQDTFEAHGAPLGEEEVLRTKEALGWPPEPAFHRPEAALRQFRRAVEAGRDAEARWQAEFAAWEGAFPDLAVEFEMSLRGNLPSRWDADIPVFPADAKGPATRAASGKIIAAIGSRLPALIGGSADLNPSTLSTLPGEGDFGPAGFPPRDPQGTVGGGWSYAGRNLHFGVREHGMGAILNGLAAHGGTLPYGATFLIFSDYMRPPIRLAAMAGLHVIYLFTHDSIGLGEDGPTHQPVEQLAGLRAIPGLIVIRPCDANETAAAWRVAVETRDRPVALVLSRQSVPTLDRSWFTAADGLRHGAYILADAPGGEPSVILLASGSEVGLAVAAREELLDENIGVRIVSMPSWELFDAQPAAYRDTVLPPAVSARLAIEAGSPQGWHRYARDVLGVTRFGASAPGATILREYGFTAEAVCARVRALLGAGRKEPVDA
ncbi:MAG: transketolase, partial [Chthoniobacteraceae bacterium]|nr:transketolase [Chthoniobacteraceae bacterium]